MGQETLEEVRDGSENPRGGLRQAAGPSRMSGTGRGTHSEVRDRSGDTRGGPGRVG